MRIDWTQGGSVFGLFAAAPEVRLLPLMVCLLLAWHIPAHGLDITDHYSPRNSERPKRKSTKAIILHTTEGPTAGSLKKLHKNGEAHYLVDTAGKVYRIIHRDRVAYHCGRSMWDGVTDMDSRTIGIEIVGYHDRDIHAVQYAALKELIEQLQGIYGIRDQHVLTHSMVAYGKPNRWHKQSHRGRKRCAMLFATSKVRERLGLKRGPAFDPDTRSHRLVVADTELAGILYGDASARSTALDHRATKDHNEISRTRSAWDIAHGAYNSASTVYRFPDGKEKRGNEIRDWAKIPAGTRVALQGEYRDNEPESVKVLGTDGSTAWDLAGSEHSAKTTIYFLPDGTVRTGDELREKERRTLPKGTRLLVGYVAAGRVTASSSAFDICGSHWNLASTYYRLADGSLVDGTKLDERAIPKGASVYLAR